MDVIEAEQEKKFFKKCITFLKNLKATMLISFNYVLMMFIAKQDIGLELISPDFESNFGFVFRFITVVANALAVGAVLVPNGNFRKLLAPAILWTVYTIFAIVQSILARVWILYQLEAPFLMYSSVFATVLFAVVVQTKLTFNIFYDHYYL